MNRNEVLLMDHTKNDFTGLCAFYPDGKVVQKKGLKIGVVIIESALDLNENRYVEKAVELIQQNDHP